MEIVKYRFRTVETSGFVHLTAHSMVTNLRYRGTETNRETPYAMILPFPTKVITIPSVFWFCSLIGIAVAAGGIWGLVDNVGTNMSMGWAAALVLGGLAMIIFAIRNRKEEWISFPSLLDGDCIWFYKNGPDSELFESFVGELLARVKSARESYG